MDTRMMSSLRTMIYSAMFLEGTYVASFQLGRACYLLIFFKSNFEKNDMQTDHGSSPFLDDQ